MKNLLNLKQIIFQKPVVLDIKTISNKVNIIVSILLPKEFI